MGERHYIMATAGHVDHGKSSLVLALTGTDPDRLPEEKARGITIDLGFAHLMLPTEEGGEWFSVGIVDVPGHEDFVKNMVAGVGSVDLALLVVAADDGWMPQSEEHLQILSYLGVKAGVVALTKADLAGPRLGEVLGSVRAQLAGTVFERAPLVPTSVLTGQGLEELRACLRRELAVVPPSRDLGKARLPVDRVFSLPGLGTVVTGTLTGGGLARGQVLRVQPSGHITRARSLQTHHADVPNLVPGTRAAVNLHDVSAGGKGGAQAGAVVRRGDVLTVPETGEPGDTMDVLLEKSARLAGAGLPASRPLKEGALVRVHHGSGNWPARVYFPGGGVLEAGTRRVAQLRFESPVFMFFGDRFIIRDWAQQSTLGGGRVLDPSARRSRLRTQAQVAFLESLTGEEALADAAVSLRALLRRDRAVAVGNAWVSSPFRAGEMTEAADRLIAAGEIRRVGDWWVDAAWWQRLLQRAQESIDATHRVHPEWPGMELNELRRVLQEELPMDGMWSAVLGGLMERGYLQAGAVLKNRAHRPTLPKGLEAAGLRIRAALAEKPFDPPSRKELLAISQGAPALRFLLENGEAVDLGGDTILAAEHFARATRIVRAYLRSHGGATASELRQALQTNRRVIIPLLERLDQDGITMRLGDKRVLRERA